MTSDITTPRGEQEAEQLRQLEAKIKAILPPRYVGCFDDVPATSMGSAGLKYGADGKVLWDDIWTSFCHLALAGGPPHRGKLLEAVPVAATQAQPVEQQRVVAELERAVRMTTELATTRSPLPGWVGIRCYDEEMAAWLVRAIVAENVIARRDRSVLLVPAGPQFRLEKEIKNVVVAVAKTCHYLLEHVKSSKRPTGLARRLIEPALPEEITAAAKYVAAAGDLELVIRQSTGLATVPTQSAGWVGVQCASQEMAGAMVRAVVVEDVLVRREDSVLCVPVVAKDASGQGREKVRSAVAQALRLWQRRQSEPAAPSTSAQTGAKSVS